MTDEFERLREQIRSVERWLDVYTAEPLNRSELETAEKLRKYLAHCRGDDKKWRSESAAKRARLRIDAIWLWLLNSLKKRRP